MVRGYLIISLLLFSCSKDAPILYSLNVSPSPSEGGYVNPRTGTYNAGETVNYLC